MKGFWHHEGLSLGDIAQALDVDCVGDPSLLIRGVSEPQEAEAEHLAIAISKPFLEQLMKGKARAALLAEGADWQALGLEGAIIGSRPRALLVALSKLYAPVHNVKPGIHPSAVIDPSAVVSPEAEIGPFAVIGPHVRIASGVKIGAHCSIEEYSELGQDTILHNGARVGPRCVIGKRVILHHNSVVGGEGFSFVTEEASAVETARGSLGSDQGKTKGIWQRIWSMGGVEIGDDAEVGVNAAVDSGTVRSTKIGARTKLDNMVDIGHNSVLGEDCLLCGQAGVAGSVKVGDRVVLGGQAGASDNIFIGDDVMAGGGTDIFTNQPAGRAILGSPAVPMPTQIEINKATRRLPRLAEQVKELQKAVSKLQGKD